MWYLLAGTIISHRVCVRTPRTAQSPRSAAGIPETTHEAGPHQCRLESLVDARSAGSFLAAGDGSVAHQISGDWCDRSTGNGPFNCAIDPLWCPASRHHAATIIPRIICQGTWLLVSGLTLSEESNTSPIHGQPLMGAAALTSMPLGPERWAGSLPGQGRCSGVAARLQRAHLGDLTLR